MKSSSHINDLRLWWRILMVICGIVISYEVISVYLNASHFFNSDTIPFTITLILEWFYIAMMVSIIIVAGLNSKVTTAQIIIFPSLLVSCTIIAICYHYFSGTYTLLHHWHDIIDNLSEKDVQVKVFIFSCSIISTGYLLYIPIFKKLIQKKVVVTVWCKIYLFFAILQPVSYFFYAMGNPYSGVILCMGCVSFVIIFTIAFLREENPLIHQVDHSIAFTVATDKKELLVTDHSVKIDEDNSQKKNNSPHDIISEIIPDVLNQKLSTKTMTILSSTILEEKLFLNKKFSIDELSIKTALPLSTIIIEYQRQGFQSFTEYLNSFRLKYFKELLKKNPKVPIAVLASDSGFPSRSGFYRYFLSIEGVSPSDYRIIHIV